MNGIMNESAVANQQNWARRYLTKLLLLLLRCDIYGERQIGEFIISFWHRLIRRQLYNIRAKFRLFASELLSRGYFNLLQNFKILKLLNVIKQAVNCDLVHDVCYNLYGNF